MKTKIITLLLLFAVALTASAQQKALEIKVLQPETANNVCDIVQIPYADITKMFFRNDSVVVATAYGEYSLSGNEVQSFGYTSISNPLQIQVNYTDDGAVVINPLAHRGVGFTKDGSHVSLTSTITDAEIEVVLSGNSTDGGLYYKGEYKMTLTFNGINLTNKQGAAVEMKCSKRIAVNLVEGTENTLVDSSDGEQKAALYFSGHPEFAGSGTLNVTGNTRHAISTKEYLQLKKSVGTINILASANDGIHAGQYFQMNGGVVTVKNVKGDGIQAEATSTADDELNGQMIIKGGTINVTTTGDDVDCMKADSLITISGGTITLTASGLAAKGIKAHTDLNITGGELIINNSGNGTLTDPSPSTSTSNASYRVYVNVPQSNTGGRPGQGGTSGTWSTVYVCKADGTILGQSAGTVSVSANGQSKTFHYYDFKQTTEGTFYFSAPDYKSGSTTYKIVSGTFSGPTDGNNHFYTLSSSYTTSGSTRTYPITDVTATYANGTIASDGTESYGASCIKVDGSLNVLGGKVTLKATGKGGKGVNCDNNVTFGSTDEGAEQPEFTAETTGTVISSSGSGMNSTLTGQPKAVRAEGDIVVNGGYINCSTKNDGGEGIESKSTITFNGGTTVCNTYDDGINAKSKITFNGGIIYSHATGNDGIDCNGSSGFEFNGGIVLSCGTNSPEEGFDCDNYSFVINGGTLIGVGGATSSPTKATQPFKSQSSQSVTANTYLSLQKTDGTVICSYKVPNTLSNATVLVSSPEFVSGTSYKLVRNTSAPTNPTATYLDGAFTLGGTISGGSSTSITPATK